MKCTRRLCPKDAVRVIDSPNGGRPWYGCSAHWPGMQESLSIGCASSKSAEVRPLTAEEKAGDAATTVQRLRVPPRSRHGGARRNRAPVA